HLGRGAEAVYDELAQASPLRRLPKKDALREIEVRLGPPAAATWELQTVVPALEDETASFAISFPSGADDTVLMQMAAENGAYKIRDLRILAEPSDATALFPVEAAAAATKAPSSMPLAI